MPRYRYGSSLKIIRAEEQLAAVTAEIGMYCEVDPSVLVGKFDEQSTAYLIHCEVGEEPPIRLPLMIGEWAHTLRSALDHLMWELVERNGGVPSSDPGNATQFPIILNPPKGPLTIRAKSGGIPEQALAFIEDAQPYKALDRGDDPAWTKLGLLAAINNYDKHRMLMLTRPCLTRGSVAVSAGSIILTQSFEGRFYDGAVVAVFAVTPEQFRDAGCLSSDDVYVDGQGSLSVAFDEEGPPRRNDVVDTLTEITAYTRQLMIDAWVMSGLEFRPRY
jgi:hypothetical protein